MPRVGEVRYSPEDLEGVFCALLMIMRDLAGESDAEKSPYR